jgi:hypothetical protein
VEEQREIPKKFTLPNGLHSPCFTAGDLPAALILQRMQAPSDKIKAEEFLLVPS